MLNKIVKFFLYSSLFLLVLNSVSAITTSANDKAYWTYDLNTTDLVQGIGLTQSGDPQYVEGIIKNATELDGTGDYWTTNSNPYDMNSSDFSISFWINATDPTPVTQEALIGNRFDQSGTNNKFLIILNTDGTLGINNRDTSAGNFNTVGTIGSGWNHIVLTRSGTTWRTYINNVNETNTGRGGDISANQNWAIGDVNNVDEFDGRIDEVFIVGYQMTAENVSDLYNSGAGFQYPFIVTPAINSNLTDYYNYNPINVSLTTSTTTNMSYWLNNGTETSICTNCDSTTVLINGTEGNNSIIWTSTVSGQQLNTTEWFVIDTITPTINVTNNTIYNTYSVNFSDIVSCGDVNLIYCNVTTDEGNTFNLTSNYIYNFTTNGNHTFNVTAVDLGDNVHTLNNSRLFIDPFVYVYFINNSNVSITNFSVNGTLYEEYFNTTIFTYGYGNWTFNFSKTGYVDRNFTLQFNNTADINETININPAKITFLVLDIDDGQLVDPGNFTILISNLDTAESSEYNITNNNTLVIENNYAMNAELSISIIGTNGSIVASVAVINPRQDINVSLYVTLEATEARIFEVLSPSLTVVPNSYVFLYVFIEGEGFKLQSQKQTNGVGEVSFDIVPNTKIYTLCNTFQGSEQCLQQIIFTDPNTDPSQIIHAQTLAGNPKVVLDYISYSYSENKTNTSTEMTFIFTDQQGLTDQFCMNVTRFTNGSNQEDLGLFCNNASSGIIVQTFSLTQDQYIDFSFLYDYEGTYTLLTKVRSYFENINYDQLKLLNVFDIIFLILYFGGIGLFLKVGNFEIYNIAVLVMLAVIFIGQAVISETFINAGLWGFVFIKNVVLYAVRYEG